MAGLGVRARRTHGPRVAMHADDAGAPALRTHQAPRWVVSHGRVAATTTSTDLLGITDAGG